jgi:hypothetical protein
MQHQKQFHLQRNRFGRNKRYVAERKQKGANLF